MNAPPLHVKMMGHAMMKSMDIAVIVKTVMRVSSVKLVCTVKSDQEIYDPISVNKMGSTLQYNKLVSQE